MLRVKKAVDKPGVRVGPIVKQERIDLGHRGRQANQVEVHTSNKRIAIGWWTGHKAFFVHAGEHVKIDRSLGPMICIDHR
jgi:hypothetical protein